MRGIKINKEVYGYNMDTELLLRKYPIVFKMKRGKLSISPIFDNLVASLSKTQEIVEINQRFLEAEGYVDRL